MLSLDNYCDAVVDVGGGRGRGVVCSDVKIDHVILYKLLFWSRVLTDSSISISDAVQYAFVISERLGRTSSKEQYAFVYR